MPQPYQRLLGASLVAVLLAASLAGAAPAIGGLGDSLLDPELARRLAPAKPKQERPATPGLLPDGDALQRMIQQGAQQAAGEDVGGSPLTEVIGAMRRAEGLITNTADNQVAVPAQREVVTHLDRLIAQMEKQCNCQGGGSCNKPSSSRRQASRRTQSKPGEPQQAEQQAKQESEGEKPGEGKKSGKPSSKPGGKPGSPETVFAGAPEASPADQKRLMKDAWGHLPERVREQMLQGPGDEFLPAYREELRQYYQRLAERSAEESP